MSRRQLLLLPGFACTAGIWRAVLDDLLPFGEVTAAEWSAEGLDTMHRLEDLVAWVRDTLHPERYDAAIGHSLGGFVLLAALAGVAAPPPVTLVETFLTVPPPFFRTLTSRDPAHDAAAASVHAMLERERPRWSPALALAMRGAARPDLIAGAPLPAAALYGARGATDPAEVVSALDWPAGLAARVPVTVIPGAAHFPMVESPRETARALRVSLH